MKKQFKDYIFYAGIFIFAAGLLAGQIINTNNRLIIVASYALTGFGCGLTLVGVGGILLKRFKSKNPQIAREYEIAEKDERNIRIREKSGYAVWYTTTFALVAAALSFVILEYKIPAFITMGVLFIHIIGIMIFIRIYCKKM